MSAPNESKPRHRNSDLLRVEHSRSRYPDGTRKSHTVVSVSVPIVPLILPWFLGDTL